ncbi:MAG: TIGR03620 family F420-dependent LLM class oxidoreductase [bacterium]|nr:LLM class F420-dependent oxidoreductase [Deltaproteobacteria bacterium]MCP4904017.1 TIGR03620 family F420-dependent LLM class oxidoreductase [bacterium]
MELGTRGIWASLENFELPQRIESAQRLERLGYSTLWQPMAMQRDLMVLSSQILAETQNLILATGIIPIFERAPAVMAAAHRTLDEQSGGRFLLGLGVSHPPIVEQMHGLVYGPPLTAMKNYLDAMDRGPDMSIFLGPDAAPGDEPAVQTGPPRVLAALGPKMLALSGNRAQGAHPYFMPPGHTRDAREILGPDAFLCPEVKVVLETDPRKARDAARAAGAANIALENYRKTWRRYGLEDADFEEGGSDRLIDATVAWGSETQIEMFLQSHLDAGATQICINFVNPEGLFAGPDWKAVEALAPGR